MVPGRSKSRGLEAEAEAGCEARRARMSAIRCSRPNGASGEGGFWLDALSNCWGHMEGE